MKKNTNELLNQIHEEREPELLDNGIMGPSYMEAAADVVFGTGEIGHINFKIAEGQLILITYYNTKEFWSIELWDNFPYFEKLYRDMETITYKEFRNKLENDIEGWEVKYA